MGHLALGERVGWLLVVLQPLAIGALAVLAALLADGNRWIAVFPALAALIALWLGQAMHAHRLATRRGSPPGGEFQVVVLLPVIVVLLSGFWMVGGGRSSPAATLQNYVAAWQAGRAEVAVDLFEQPADPTTLDAQWRSQRSRIDELIAAAAARYGSGSGIDPARPFNSLRFEQLPSSDAARTAIVTVDLVRQRSIETTLFGIIPTATQQTVRVERLALVELVARPAPVPAWLPINASPSLVWLIAELDFIADRQ
jgi:hypothetical protein